MKTSQAGIDLLKRSEGFRAQVYEDSAGYSTIGYGHKLLATESFPDGVTEAEAETLLASDLEGVERAIEHLAGETLTQGQWDALCDFSYNLGVGSLRMMVGHGLDQVPRQILRWCNVAGKPSAPLLKRREDELALWNS